MANFNGQKLTNKGKELLTRAQTEGKALLWTKIAIGSSTYNGDIEALEDLVNEKLEAKMVDSNNLGDIAELVGRFSNEAIEDEFEVRELGIFGKIDGDNHSILYSYANSKDISILPNKSVPHEIEQTIYTKITDGDTINVYIDPQLQYLTKEVSDTLYEPVFSKNSGFNREKTDSISLANSLVLATAKAVKTAYDKAVSALNTANTKEPKITKKTGFNLDKTDSTATDSSIILATAKAIKVAYDKVIEVLGFTNINKTAIENNTEQIENLTSKQILFDGLIDSKGTYSLSGNWDNFDEIIFIARSYTAVNIKHTTFYTEYITASDSTNEQAAGECRVYEATGHLIGVIFRDTNRNEVYCNEISGGRIEMIIGKGKKKI